MTCGWLESVLPVPCLCPIYRLLYSGKAREKEGVGRKKSHKGEDFPFLSQTDLGAKCQYLRVSSHHPKLHFSIMETSQNNRKVLVEGVFKAI